MSDRLNKKAQFEQPKGMNKKVVAMLVGVVLAAAVGFAVWQPWAAPPPKGGNFNTGTKPGYGPKVGMVNLPEVKGNNGMLELSLEEIKQNKLIRTEYKNGSTTLPLLAYVAPNGRLVTAVSVCEPCQSTTFTIKGDELACNQCDTRWDLNTLKGKSGGCLIYPPDELKYEVQGDKVLIPEKDAANWQPRI